jgi:hypothetical protein
VALQIAFLNGIADRRHQCQVRNNPGPCFFTGSQVTSKLTAIPLGKPTVTNREFLVQQMVEADLMVLQNIGLALACVGIGLLAGYLQMKG